MSTKAKRMYMVQARLIYQKGGWSGSAGLPTFLLDPDIQCIQNTEHAKRIAKRIINPLGEFECAMEVAEVLVKTDESPSEKEPTEQPTPKNLERIKPGVYMEKAIDSSMLDSSMLPQQLNTIQVCGCCGSSAIRFNPRPPHLCRTCGVKLLD